MAVANSRGRVRGRVLATGRQVAARGV